MYIKAVDFKFPPPVGKVLLHYVARDQNVQAPFGEGARRPYRGPLLVVDQVLQLFDGQRFFYKSKESMRQAIAKCKGHNEIIMSGPGDKAMLDLLKQHKVITPTVYKVTMMSHKCFRELLVGQGLPASVTNVLDATVDPDMIFSRDVPPSLGGSSSGLLASANDKRPPGLALEELRSLLRRKTVAVPKLREDAVASSSSGSSGRQSLGGSAGGGQNVDLATSQARMLRLRRAREMVRLQKELMELEQLRGEQDEDEDEGEYEMEDEGMEEDEEGGMVDEEMEEEGRDEEEEEEDEEEGIPARRNILRHRRGGIFESDSEDNEAGEELDGNESDEDGSFFKGKGLGIRWGPRDEDEEEGEEDEEEGEGETEDEEEQIWGGGGRRRDVFKEHLLKNVMQNEMQKIRQKKKQDDEMMDEGRGGGGDCGDTVEGRNYSIALHDMNKGLQKEVALILHVASDRGINELRRGAFKTAVTKSTLERMEKGIRKYFGFLKNVKRVKKSALSLVMFANTSFMFSYFRFLQATRGVKGEEINKQATLAGQICRVLANMLGEEEGALYLGAKAQIKEMREEFVGYANRMQGATIVEEKFLPRAGQAIAWVENVMDKALEMADGVTEFIPEVWTAVRNASMLAMTVGHVGLAMRISMTRTVKATLYSKTKCRHKECVAPGCCGNCMVEVAQGDEEPPIYKLRMPHHKNSWRGIAMPIITITSPKLRTLIKLWEDYGRPGYVDHISQRKPRWKDPQTLFITTQGNSYRSLNEWSDKVHRDEEAPYPLITLNQYRHVFVTDRIENPDRPGPSNEAAAMVMGNSERTWRKNYNPNQKIRNAQAVSTKLATYRQALLDEEAQFQKK